MPDYELLKRLGVGNFGEVWLVYDRALDVKRAVKYIRRDRIHDPTDFYREPRALMDLRHDHIVRVRDAGTLEGGTLYIAMDYLRRGSLEDRFHGLPLALSLARRYVCGVCWGLEYAHGKGYVHRDIKPANILVGDDSRGKLSDFGLATRVPRGASASPYGYLTHLAPEALHEGVAGCLADVYALGVTAYRLVNGDAFLPSTPDFGELQDLILAGQYPDRNRYRPYVPSQLKRVINSAMNTDPEKRTPSAAALRRQLERLEIHCDWRWKSKRGNVKYTASVDGVDLAVHVIRRDNGRFDIETRRRRADKDWRRIRRDCANGLTLTKLKQSLRQILSRYVVEGR